MDRKSVPAGESQAPQLHAPGARREPERKGPTMTPRSSQLLREFALLVLLFSSLLEARCTSVPPRPSFRQRAAAYFAVHRDVPPDVIEAIKLGHVLPGMDRDQVWVVLGEPLQRKPSRASSRIEQWLYPAYRIHQDHFRSQAAFLFKITFIDGRVTGIDPL